MIFPYNDTDRILFITLEIVIDIQEPVNNCPDENIATVKNVDVDVLWQNTKYCSHVFLPF